MLQPAIHIPFAGYHLAADSLEDWTHEDTLALCASYSGETEETLSCFEDAGAKGIPRVALTTGGRLAEPLGGASSSLGMRGPSALACVQAS